MKVNITETAIPGVLLIETSSYKDRRGYFKELFHAEDCRSTGLDHTFVQDNLSCSSKNVLRGLHYQLNTPQGKLVSVLSGEIYDVAVDIRKGSPTFLNWIGYRLSERNNLMLYIPGGFAHGFCSLADESRVLYKCTDFYRAGDQYGILWSDERLGIKWPVSDPVISAKDSGNPSVSRIPEANFPEYIK